MASLTAHLIDLIALECTGDIDGLTTYTSRRGGKVFFPAAPPEVPSSSAQLLQRSRWSAGMWLWANASNETRAAYRRAVRTARLRITATNLWLSLYLRPDPAALATINRLSGETLQPPKP